MFITVQQNTNKRDIIKNHNNQTIKEWVHQTNLLSIYVINIKTSRSHLSSMVAHKISRIIQKLLCFCRIHHSAPILQWDNIIVYRYYTAHFSYHIPHFLYYTVLYSNHIIQEYCYGGAIHKRPLWMLGCVS